MIILKNYAIIALTATLSFSISLQGASAQNIELTLGELNNGRGPNNIDADRRIWLLMEIMGGQKRISVNVEQVRAV